MPPSSKPFICCEWTLCVSIFHPHWALPVLIQQNWIISSFASFNARKSSLCVMMEGPQCSLLSQKWKLLTEHYSFLHLCNRGSVFVCCRSIWTVQNSKKVFPTLEIKIIYCAILYVADVRCTMNNFESDLTPKNALWVGWIIYYLQSENYTVIISKSLSLGIE